ncbi:putative transmemembrane reductase oxidoreductase protein [Blastopirellula marina DSM 3645]|uniref:Putative transmemembrane reductase oxidoreductase protein n=2 Tax=Blastopirellula marina TaxID=124 RepID=A4A0Z6_9BACT|nr:putative transmemembrane reductase oxidoreductase protein [Blastopirellula marina DSM 3645]
MRTPADLFRGNAAIFDCERFYSCVGATFAAWALPRLARSDGKNKEFAMRIGVIGMGNVGRALAPQWAKHGHQVTLCVRDPADPQRMEEAAAMNVKLGPVSAAGMCEVIVLAIPFTAVSEVLRSAGDLTGKLILDCTNPVNQDLSDLTMGYDRSAGEEIAQLAPTAQVVKILNTNGAKNMTDPDYGDHRVTMFYAGDDPAANRIAAQLAAELGFEPIELGPLKMSRLLEPLAMTWIILARHRGLGRDFGIDVVRRPQK